MGNCDSPPKKTYSPPHCHSNWGRRQKLWIIHCPWSERPYSVSQSKPIWINKDESTNGPPPMNIFQSKSTTANPGNPNQRVPDAATLPLLIIACLLESDVLPLHLQQQWYQLLAQCDTLQPWREIWHWPPCLSRQPTMVMRCIFFGDSPFEMFKTPCFC